MLKVIEEVGLPAELLGEKYIEVWNKIDLVGESEAEKQAFQERVEWAAEQDQYPIILTSCT